MPSRMFDRRAVALLGLLALGGCETIQQNQKAFTGGLLGAGAAGGACLLARGNPLLCGLLAVAGGAAGGAIGHSLDSRDQTRRDAALALALANAPSPAAPLPASVNYSAAPGSADHAGTAYAATASAPAPASTVTRHTSTTHRQAVPATLQVAGGPPNGAQPWVNPDGAVQWVNPDTRNSGTVTATSSFADTATGRACHDIDESYVRDGNRTTQTERACQQANGSWSFTDIAART